MNWHDDLVVWAGMVDLLVRETQTELAECVQVGASTWERRMKEWDADDMEKQPNGVSP